MHRRVVSSALDALLSLQGDLCQPAEAKVVVHTNGTYELQGIQYPLGVTIEHLQRLATRSSHITSVYVDFHVQGSTGRGAVCALVNPRRRKVDEDEEVTQREEKATSSGYVRLDDGAARRRTSEGKSSEDNEPGWLAKLFGAK